MESSLQRRAISVCSDHSPGCPRVRKKTLHDAMGAHTLLVERSEHRVQNNKCEV